MRHLADNIARAESSGSFWLEPTRLLAILLSASVGAAKHYWWILLSPKKGPSDARRCPLEQRV